MPRRPFVLWRPARGYKHVVEKFQAMKVREALNRLQDWQLMDAETLRSNLANAIETKNVRILDIVTSKAVTLPDAAFPYQLISAKGAIRAQRLIVNGSITSGGDIKVSGTIKAGRIKASGIIIAGRIEADEVCAKSDIRTTENLKCKTVSTSGDLRVGWELDASHFIAVAGQIAAQKITQQSVTAASSDIRDELKQLYQQQETSDRLVSLGMTNRP